MNSLLLALAMIAAAVVAYFTYGRFLGRKVFQLSRDADVPSKTLRDDVDYVPADKHVLFGHHFTTIAGLGPIIGPAIGIIWGWVPAFLWILFGSIFIGAVHDFGTLIVSMRHKGWSVGELSRKLVGPRVRVLFLLISFFLLLLVIAVFALIIAILFDRYPEAVIPVWIEVPLAIGLGLLVYKKGMNHKWLAIIAIITMYVFVVVGAYVPVDLKTLVFASMENPGQAAIIAWMLILFVYAYVASTLPVQTLLQPRDYLNSHQLIIAMAILFIGILWAQPAIVAPAVDASPSGAPPIWPFLFVVVACGAVSGFHCLASSGTTSKQCSSEPDARFVGYGGMLTEAVLATLVIVAVAGGLGVAWFVTPEEAAGADFAPYMDQAQYEVADEEAGTPERYRLTGEAAFDYHYRSWNAASGLPAKLDAFVYGSANMIATVADHIPGVRRQDIRLIVLAVMAVFLVSFAATTLDSATRIQRYVIQELGSTFKELGRGKPLATAAGGAEPPEDDEHPTAAGGNRGAVPTVEQLPATPRRAVKHIATAIAVVTAMALAFYKGDGKGALTLWPLFGAVNQLMAGLALLVLTIYLARKKVRTLYASIPMVFMIFMTGWALIAQLKGWLLPADPDANPEWVLFGIGVVILLLEIWMIIESAAVLRRLRTEHRTEEPTA